MKLRPIGNKLLVSYIDQPTQVGGIHLPEQTGPATPDGIIIAIGNGVLDEALKPGVRVILPAHGMIEVRVNRRPYFLVRETELLGVL